VRRRLAPGTDGVEATGQITGDACSADTDRPIKVLILTTYNLDEAVYAAARAGASAFPLEDMVPGELVRAVHAVARGDGWLDPAVTPNLLREFAARPGPLLRSTEEIREPPAGNGRSSYSSGTVCPTGRSPGG
jgi:DNA-binding NarL/FixJ family response regulator